MKEFQDIRFEVVRFDGEDIICSSGELDNLYGLYGNEEWQDGER